MIRVTPLACLMIWGGLAMLATLQASAQTREEKVREDRRRVESEGFWIYNDWQRARTIAAEKGKPIVVVLRCVPCEECVKLDDHLVDQDPVLRPLLEQFVRVRLVSTNGLDLDLFQYDFDQSFAVFLLNAEGTIYGRFGTRSHRTEWVGDVSLAGLAAALQGALDLHKDYPSNKLSLIGKRGQPLEFPSPEKFPSLSDRYQDKLASSGEIAKSCIHCHQIGDAQREYYRMHADRMPEYILFPYPHPKVVGLNLDATKAGHIKSVADNSAAEMAGLRAGDVITHLIDQPVLSAADIQWVLHHAKTDGDAIDCTIIRGGETKKLTLMLADGWRRADDISWRASSWNLRRMATGGAVFESISPEDRDRLGLAEDKMGLRAKHVGQYGAHAIAKKAGLKSGDILIEFAGQRNLMTETQLLAFGLNHYRPGEKVSFIINRDGAEHSLQMTMQP